MTRRSGPTPLVVRVASPESVRLGSEVRFAIDVANTGDRPLRDVVVRVELSDGLEHATQGPNLELSMADLPSYREVLRPGETIALPPLIVRAAGIGNHECVVTASSADPQVGSSTPVVGRVFITPGPDQP